MGNTGIIYINEQSKYDIYVSFSESSYVMSHKQNGRAGQLRNVHHSVEY